MEKKSKTLCNRCEVNWIQFIIEYHAVTKNNDKLVRHDFYTFQILTQWNLNIILFQNYASIQSGWKNSLKRTDIGFLVTSREVNNSIKSSWLFSFSQRFFFVDSVFIHVQKSFIHFFYKMGEKSE